MAGPSEFERAFRSSYSQKGGKSPPERQETGAAKPKTTPQQTQPIFKPQEHKPSAFENDFRNYNTMMSKELERINKEAQKAEQDIIKQQQREGGAGLGAGVPLGDPTMAQEPLSTTTGGIPPQEAQDSLYGQSVPPMLQQTAFPQQTTTIPEQQVAPTQQTAQVETQGPPQGDPTFSLAPTFPPVSPESMAAAGDVLGAFGSGAASFLPSLLGGYLEGTIPTAFPQVGVPAQPAPRKSLTSKEKAQAVTEVQDTIAEALAIMPKTEVGQELTELAGWPFEKVQQFATWSSEAIVPETQPFLRKIVEDIIHLGTYVVAHKTLRIGKKGFKEGVSRVKMGKEGRAKVKGAKVELKQIEAEIKKQQGKLPKRLKEKTTTFLKNIKAEVTENLKGRPEFTETEMQMIEAGRQQGGTPAARFVMDEILKAREEFKPEKRAPVPEKKAETPTPEVKKKASAKQTAKQAQGIIEEAGGNYVGEKARATKGEEPVVQFNEPTTNTTIDIPIKDVTPERVKSVMEKAVERYRKAETAKAVTESIEGSIDKQGNLKYAKSTYRNRIQPLSNEELIKVGLWARKKKGAAAATIRDLVSEEVSTRGTAVIDQLNRAVAGEAPVKPRTEAEMKASVEKSGAIWGAINKDTGKVDTTPWPATKKYPEGLRNFNSPYTESTLVLEPSKITPESVKAKMLENYVKTREMGGEIVKLWDEGEKAFAQTKIEGVKPAAPEPTKPPATVYEIPKEEFHKVRSGDKKDVAKEFVALSKRAPDSLSDVPKDQPTWIQVEHEGTLFTIPNTAYALETFAKKISKLKEGRVGPTEPPHKERPISKQSGSRPKVDADAGDTYIRIFDKNTKFKKPSEKDVWEVRYPDDAKDVIHPERDKGGPYLMRGKVGKQTFFTDGRIVEFRDSAPTLKVKGLEFYDATKDMGRVIDGFEGKGTHKPAKPVFDTEVGVAIMNKENGFFVAHEYFDYLHTKYGPKLQWKIPEPGSGMPVTFSVDGKLKGYLMPLNDKMTLGSKGKAYTPHNILAERMPEGFGPGPTLEAGGFQTMYEGLREMVRTGKFFESTYYKARGLKDYVMEDIVDPLKFYPDLPKEYVNDIRVHMVAALDKARHAVYSKEGYAGRIFGDMKKGEIYDAVELIYARDEVGRQKASRGNPEITLEQAVERSNKLESTASKEVLRAAEEWRAVTDEVQADLVRRGVLRGPDPKTGYEGQFIEDYAPHAVGVYTPEWAYTVGIPTRIRTPFRSFGQKAKGSIKEIVKDADTLLGHLLKVEHTNMIEDFIIRETAKYDILPTLDKAQKIKLFGSKKHERMIKSKAHPEGVLREIEVANTPKPGRIWTEAELVKVDPAYKGKGDHWSYTPDQPFSRTLFQTEEGYLALGKYKNVSLIPADIFRSFKSFSESGSATIYRINLINGYWKNMAILSHYPSFNMNNMIGDTFMAAIQHPEPTKLLIEMETSLKYLGKELFAKSHKGYMKELHEFIQNEDILGASFFQTELPKNLSGSKNPIRKVLDMTMTISQMREGINRTAYASTLLKAMKEGRGKELIKAHSWIDTKGLSEQAALGKIAREVLVDYAAVSKRFRRIGRGMLTPFGTWYFHNSRLVHRWMWKNKGKGLISMLAAPLAAQAWNNRDEAARLREEGRPDWLRNKIHFDIGGTAAGDVRTWAVQLPQDVLIGTKIFSIATEMSSRVARGEINPANGKPWTPRDAALRTIKDWGVQEYRGVAYLMAPLIRFFIGLKDRRDPYDKVPIYSSDYNKLNPMQRKWEGAQFFLKTMVPMLGANIVKTQQKKQPMDLAFRDFLNNFVGKEALGIFDVTPKGELRLSNGKVYSMDDTARIKWVSNQNLQHFNDIERAYVGYRGSNQDFIQTDKFKKVLVEMFDDMSKIDPGLFKPSFKDEAKSAIISQLYGARLVNMLTDPGTQQNRMEVMIKRAKTDEEKLAIRKDFEKQRQMRIFTGLRRQPKTEREIMFKHKMDGSALPWQLELYMPP